jgi:hypothetical protein
MPTRRFVFVPLAGSGTPASGWAEMPHIKAWGFLVDEEPQLTAIHTEGDAQECIRLFHPCAIFDAEIAAAVDVPENSPDLPDAVCKALAQLALAPETLELGEAN